MAIRDHHWYQRLQIAADQLITQVVGEVVDPYRGVKPASSGRKSLQLGSLEPRILFSATPIDPAVFDVGDHGNDESAMVMTVETEATGHSDDSQSSQTSPASDGVQSVTELVIIDANVPDLQELLDDLRQSRPNASVVVLDADRDGVEQIGEILDSHSNLASLHIVSHGQDSSVRLGNVSLGNENLAAYSGQIAQWQSALASDADILFYGCDLASQPDGIEFLESIQVLTDADIAASDDLTGHADRGANWDFEFHAGQIETDVAFSAHFQSNWDHDLAGNVIDVTILDDIVDAGDSQTSLREAVAQAVQGDTIRLGAGTHLVNNSIDLSKDLTIIGLDARSTIIDASQASDDRIFNIDTNSVVDISRVTFQGGSQDGGGAIRVRDTSTLNLTDAILRNNTSDEGGAIHVHGTLNLNRVLLTENTAADAGGAIHFHNSSTGTLTNVTISNNTSIDDGGGGIFVESSGTVTIINSTIVGNDASRGGGIENSSGTVILQNTIVAENTSNNSHADVSGTFVSDGSNLIGTLNGSSGLSGDTVSANIGLTRLGNYGGQTDTHALQANSIAINAGALTGAPAQDGRGVARTGAVDIGAYEFVEFATTDEFRVNTTTGNQQVTSAEDRGSHHAISLAGDGSYVVVWTSQNQNGTGSGVYARRFDSAGNAITAEILIADTANNDQEWARVASAGDGTFVVTWTSDHTGDLGVYYRRFAADGTALTTQRSASTTTSGEQKNSVIAMNAATGEFVIAWQGNGDVSGQADPAGIFAQRFDATGETIGSETRVNTVTSGTQFDTSIAMNDAGEFVIVWDDGGGVHFRRFNDSGAVGSSQTNVDGAVNSGNADVAIHRDGSFVITWREGPTDDRQIYLRRYSSGGSSLTGAVTVNTFSTDNQTNPSIGMDSSGRFIIVWEGRGPGDTEGVFAQRFQAEGNTIGDNFLVNQTTNGSQLNASVVLRGIDDFVVVWSGNGERPENVDASGVFARQFGTAPSVDPNDAPILTASSTNPTFTENGPTSVSLFNAANASTVESGQTFNELTLTVTNVFNGVDELLTIDGGAISLTNGNSGTTTGNSLDYVVTVSGNLATLTLVNMELDSTQLNSVVNTIGYRNTSENPNTNARVVTIASLKDSGGTDNGGNDTSSPNLASTVNVVAVNDAPTISGGPITLVSTDEDNPSRGTRVSALIDGLASDDVDGNTLGIAITSANGNGNWEFSSNSTDGSDGDWVSLTTVSNGNALLLSTSSWIRYQPDMTNGENVQIEFAAWDGTFGTASTNADPITADRGVGGATSAFSSNLATASLAVTSLNDNSPVIDPGQSGTVSEDSANGTSIFTVTATDVDSGTTLTGWAITSGNTGDAFSINASTGEIRVNDSSQIDYEVNTSYTLSITVSDGINTSATQTITVEVSNANDAATGRPTIVGTSIDGSTLSVDSSAIVDQDGVGTTTYQWYRDGVEVTSATSNQYRLRSNDVGSRISVAVSFIDGQGNSEGPLLSEPTDAVIVDPVAQFQVVVAEAARAAVSSTTDSPSSKSSSSDSSASESSSNESSTRESSTTDSSGTDSNSSAESDSKRSAKATAVQAASNSGQDSQQSVEATVTLPVAMAEKSVDALNEGESSAQENGTDNGLSIASDSSNQSRSLRSSQGDSANTIRDATRIDNEAAGLVWEDMVALTRPGAMWDDLDQRRNQVEYQIQGDLIVVGSAGAAASSFTVGVVAWAMRSGFLVTGLIAHMPAWSGVDPLIIMQGMSAAGSQETLEELMDRQAKAIDAEEASS